MRRYFRWNTSWSRIAYMGLQCVQKSLYCVQKRLCPKESCTNIGLLWTHYRDSLHEYFGRVRSGHQLWGSCWCSCRCRCQGLECQSRCWSRCRSSCRPPHFPRLLGSPSEIWESYDLNYYSLDASATLDEIIPLTHTHTHIIPLINTRLFDEIIPLINTLYIWSGNNETSVSFGEWSHG